MKRRRVKSQASKSDDEGFESPTSPNAASSVLLSNGELESAKKVAPLANQEDLEEEEKHEREITKEAQNHVIVDEPSSAQQQQNATMTVSASRNQR